jgi:uncharacterized protein (TIGR02996 family)
MTEDETFVRAIRANPDDETARLAYADWLDDRADPRAAYLRAEAAWVALQPADEQYRPLFRRVSQLAAALDPEWFADVSRMGHIVRRAWDPASRQRWSPQEPAGADLPREWGEAVESLCELFAETFGFDEVRQRFCAPADWAALLCVVGGMSDGIEYHCASRSLPELNRESVDIYRPGQSAAEEMSDDEARARPEHPEMWVEFGGAGERYADFVCCDLGSRLFGVVAVGEDYHPWMLGSDVPHFHFLGRNLLHTFVRFRPGSGEPRHLVPHSEWATF